MSVFAQYFLFIYFIRRPVNTFGKNKNSISFESCAASRSEKETGNCRRSSYLQNVFSISSNWCAKVATEQFSLHSAVTMFGLNFCTSFWLNTQERPYLSPALARIIYQILKMYGYHGHWFLCHPLPNSVALRVKVVWRFCYGGGTWSDAPLYQTVLRSQRKIHFPC